MDSAGNAGQVVGRSAVLLGEQSLLIQCGDAWLAHGHHIAAVATRNARILDWCVTRGIVAVNDFTALRALPAAQTFDYLISITNLRMVPAWLRTRPSRLAINFHDGPLPRYAGLNTPVWALIAGEREYGITWHRMDAEADTGPILVARQFAISPEDTAFSLNARCYEAGLEAFVELTASLDERVAGMSTQDFARRTYFGLTHRPAGAAVLDWQRDAMSQQRLVQALDFGTYRNPVLLPRIDLGTGFVLVRRAHVVPVSDQVASGTVLETVAGALTVRCSTDALCITRITDLRGEDLDIADVLGKAGIRPGDRLPSAMHANGADAAAVDAWLASACRHEPGWVEALRRIEPPDVPFQAHGSTTESPAAAASAWRVLAGHRSVGASADEVRADGIALTALLLARLSGKHAFTLDAIPASLLGLPAPVARLVAPSVPFNLDLRMEETIAALRDACRAQWSTLETRSSHLSELVAREPELRALAQAADMPVRVVAIDGDASDGVLGPEAAARHAGDAVLTVLLGRDGSIGLRADGHRLSAHALDRLHGCLAVLRDAATIDPSAAMGDLPLLTGSDREALLAWDALPEGTLPTAGPPDDPLALRGRTLTDLFERQVRLDPHRIACIFEGEEVTYDALDRAANRLARHLQATGTRPDDLVGVMVERSIDMLIALYAVHKAGAAYVPLDPVYPEDRLAYMIEDAQLRTVITQRAFAARLSVPNAILLDALHDAPQVGDDEPLHLGYSDDALAYVIYTSGSTGKPKGVMVEHRQVVNFFIGMDGALEPGPGCWLAVTSISFDISVLELFWTLARGFTIVLHADATRQKAIRPAAARASRVVASDGARQGLEFGLFYWNVADDDSQHSADKYRLLLEGARYADENGFNAVWNPERHFESFGGLFPNPAVTAAALATITRRVGLRAGSCVVPLHSPIRIAEEWAVVDNLSGGRVGVSIAAGWAQPDFAIRPESFANAKQVMYESAELVQRLWRGEHVPFNGPNGEVMVRTLPRPVQPELPLWVTTAGNLETFEQAGTKGLYLLTHLLGQSVQEVAAKVRAYRDAWSRAGHAGRGTVTLMLHTFVGQDAAEVESIVRGPMKAYLNSAMNLVRSAAWQFPTFRKLSDEQGRTLDEFFADIAPQDLDDLLEFAFQRYFHDSGLFGTPEHCMAMVARAVGADVDEIACLIDFGIDTDTVLAHLPHLDELRRKAQDIHGTRFGTEPVLAAAHTDASRATASDDHSLPALFARHAITHFQCTPSMATMLVADDDARPHLGQLRQMMVGGEAFPPALAQALHTLVAGRVTNMYGPTETTIWSAVGDVDGTAGTSVPIGRALPNQRLYVLDAQQRPLPPGVAGELFIAGDGVVRGYWHRPTLTAERFLPDPAHPGARMYRTGDLGRHLEDGRLECLGRVDQQVKIRGYRVELGEIEALLRGHPAVRDAAVLLREDVPGDQRLVAYIRVHDGAEVTPEELATSLRRELPEFMVPSAYVFLAALPLTPNGKLDRRALPAPQLKARGERAHTPPRNEVEALVSDIWQRALGIEHVGTRENFFDIGGHSLLVVQVLKELRERLARPIQMTDLFRYTTIEALATFLGGEDAAPRGSERGRSRADARRAAMQRRRD